jgi:peptidoglycan hydrolase CwlO-like protein
MIEMKPTEKTAFDNQVAELEAKRKLLTGEFSNLQVIDEKLKAIDKLEADIKRLKEDIAKREQKK